jgi:hypothetical protein
LRTPKYQRFRRTDSGTGLAPQREEAGQVRRPMPLILWLLGVPLSLIIILWLMGVV